MATATATAMTTPQNNRVNDEKAIVLHVRHPFSTFICHTLQNN